MSKGTVLKVIRKERQSDKKPYWNVIMLEGEKSVGYLTSDAGVEGKEGQELEYTTRPAKEAGGIPWLNLGAGGRPPYAGPKQGGMRGGNESFALSYAKDIVVCLLTRGSLPNDSDIPSTLDFYFNFFMERLGKKE